MKAILVAPPYVQDDSFGRGTLFSTPQEHLGIESILAYATQEGLAVDCLSCPIDGLGVEEAAERLIALAPDLIGISCKYEQIDLLGSRLLARRLRQLGYSGVIIAGGMAATFLADEILQEGDFDAIVMGEGEMVFAELLEALSSGHGFEGIEGLCYRSSEGSVKQACAACLPDLDCLPVPKRDLLAKVFSQQNINGIPVETSRGCWANCSFCLVPSFYGRKWRPRSMPKVVREIQDINQRYGARQFEFIDDNFFGPVNQRDQRASELAELLESEHLDIQFALSCRADSVQRDRIQRLVDVGLCRIYVGIESGSTTMLNRYSKGLTVEENRRAVEILHTLEIPANCCFIMFDPFTTVQELRETIGFIRNSGAHLLGMRPYNLLNSLLVIKGTPMYDRLKDTDLLIPYGKMLYNYRFLDSKVETIYKAVSVIDGMISPMDIRFRKVLPRYTALVNALSQALGMKQEAVRSIPELRWGFMESYIRWHNGLPPLVLDILDSVTSLVDCLDPRHGDNVYILRVAIADKMNDWLRKCFGAQGPYAQFGALTSLLDSPILSLSIPCKGVQTYDNPIYRTIG